MKKRHISIYYIIALVFCQLFSFGSAVFADTENFYFKDFTADYYLSRDSKGISHLRVVENLTAVFPDFKQNKGICRFIPFTNQDGVNLTVEKLNRSNIKLLRNGESEPIYSISKENDFYEVCTGDENYVLGEQVYTFEYEFSRVVTDLSGYQELYWDTNGNGWNQKFEALTARVHFADDILGNMTDKAWCYVGKYGESGQDKCEISKISDGFSFSAKDLMKNENLTFDIEILAGTFNVPAPKKSYLYIYVTIAVAIVCLIVTTYSLRKYLKERGKIKFYKEFFINPEYQPHEKYSLEEMGELYIGKKKDIKVAMLLEMIVRKNISLVQGEGKFGRKKWSIVVNNLDGISAAEEKLLMILNGGSSIQGGDTIIVEWRQATSKLVTLNSELKNEIINELKHDGLVENKYRFGESSSSMVSSIVSSVFVNLMAYSILPFGTIEILKNSGFVGVYVHKEDSIIDILAIIFATSLVSSIFGAMVSRVKNYTIEGLRMSRYMDGLKLYIKMAEKERLAFLQSVNNVEVSPEGVVKVYEKLLPYAAVFGLEKSWLEEMSKYCQVNEISEPSYLATGVVASELAGAVRSTASIAAGMSSSGGGSSSSFSGGGGGGFSGGGGGGGGGCGR
ncbi:MAG: DUF2207 domain-containing protein [Candidatus Saccharibacteria bacterium]|nr:DUF2207 domain-containing protein [Candidatus Saccharibacteria bacterium]